MNSIDHNGDCPDGGSGAAQQSTADLLFLVHALTAPCADNGREFTRTERIDRIRDLLAASDYSLMAELPLAFVWRHRDFDPTQPVMLVSSHIDSLYRRFHSSLERGILLGTYDNSITNAVVIERMLRGCLPPQVLVAFTGDEERGSRGASQVVEFLGTCSPTPIHPELTVVLDVTEEAYDTHSASFENLFVRGGGEFDQRLNLPDRAALAEMIRALPDLTDPFIIPQGAPDESWQYGRQPLNCFALCLPIETITGDMHDDEGVFAKLDAVIDYAEILSRVLSGMLAEIRSSHWDGVSR